MVLIAENEGEGYLTPIAVKKRPIPPVIPDKIVKGDKEATVFIQDIYAGEGLPNVPKGAVKKLRIFAYEYAYMKSPSDFDALGVQSGWDLKRELGTVMLKQTVRQYSKFLQTLLLLFSLLMKKVTLLKG